jgi:putative transposase
MPPHFLGQGGGLYRYSQKITGWNVRSLIPQNLVSEARRRALVVRRPVVRFAVHSG